MDALNKVIHLGDECDIVVPKTPIDCSKLTPAFDELEYDCWELFKSYCATLGIILEIEDDCDISFDIAKGIQEHILSVFKDAGVKFKF